MPGREIYGPNHANYGFIADNIPVDLGNYRLGKEARERGEGDKLLP